MTENQINRKERNAAIIAYLNTYVQKWSMIPKVGEVKNEFEFINTQIEEAQEAQSGAQIFVGKNKIQLKKIISEKADIINDIAETHALITGDIELEQKMAATFTDFYRLKNDAFVIKVKETIQYIEENKEPLIAEYGLTEEQIIDLKTDFNSYLKLLGQPRAYQIASQQATSSLGSLFTQANEVLTTKLDKVMKLFKRRDTNFYNGYLAARTIIGD